MTCCSRRRSELKLCWFYFSTGGFSFICFFFLGHPSRNAADKSFRPNVVVTLVVLGTLSMLSLTKLQNSTYTSNRFLFFEVLSNRGGMLEYTIGYWNYTSGRTVSVFIVLMSADLRLFERSEFLINTSKKKVCACACVHVCTRVRLFLVLVWGRP